MLILTCVACGESFDLEWNKNPHCPKCWTMLKLEDRAAMAVVDPEKCGDKVVDAMLMGKPYLKPMGHFLPDREVGGCSDHMVDAIAYAYSSTIHPTRPPTPWWERVWWAVRGYFRTVGRAVAGRRVKEWEE